MHPKPPDRTRKWTHGARILPFLPRKAYMRRRCCQEGGLLRAFGGKGDAYGAILASWALGPPQCKEGMRGFMGRRGGWRRWRARQWWVLRCRGAAGGHGGAGARRWWVLRAGALTGAALRRGGCDAGDSTGTRGTAGAMEAGDGCREESGLARRNTPARVAAIRPNWRALPQRALRALR